MRATKAPAGGFRLAVAAIAAAVLSAPGVGAQPQTSPAAVMDAAGQVHAFLDELEKAFSAREAGVTERFCSDQILAVVEPSGPGSNPVVLDKKALDTAVRAAFDAGATAPERRFTERQVDASPQWAQVRTTLVDRWPDGRSVSTRELRILRIENGGWKMLLSAPDLAPRAACVIHCMPNSQAAALGIPPGAVVVSYAGQTISGHAQLINFIRLNSATPSAPRIPLVVRVDGVERTFLVKPGMLGIRLEDRLLPDDKGESFGPGQSHPVTDAFASMVQRLSERKWAAFVNGCCSQGALVLSASEAGGSVTGPALTPRALREAAQASDTASIECFDVRAVVRGGLAVVSGRAILRKRRGGFHTSVLTHVYARQNAAWRLVFATENGGPAGAAAPLPPSASEIAGEWDWFNGARLTVLPYGGFNAKDKAAGRWLILDPATRRYMLIWDSGPVDDLALSPDSSALTGRNHQGAAVWGKRASATAP